MIKFLLNWLAKLVLSHIDQHDMARRLGWQIEYKELATYVDYEELAKHCDANDIASWVVDRPDLVEEVAAWIRAEDLVRELDMYQLAELVNEEVASDIDASAVADLLDLEMIAQSVDMGDLCCYLDSEAIASYVDQRELGKYVDTEQVAKHVDVDCEEIVDASMPAVLERIELLTSFRELGTYE